MLLPKTATWLAAGQGPIPDRGSHWVVTPAEELPPIMDAHSSEEQGRLVPF